MAVGGMDGPNRVANSPGDLFLLAIDRDLGHFVDERAGRLASGTARSLLMLPSRKQNDRRGGSMSTRPRDAPEPATQ